MELFDGILHMPTYGVKGFEVIKDSKHTQLVPFKTDESDLSNLRW